ncbi:hypothetical protein TCDM_13348 [Trypanosoma cruzi Dm28c]|uniref:Uncharacterized protein n=1 Tax=Trypanosoma cruzi Dm28c TaxID=1416333 RepID=V5ANI2_TRYCR|nr:hypothetical protein TCDM_13348 [Trypanosoma cruzi Dm28c]
MKRRKEEAVRVRRGSHPLWKCCTACGGIALKCRTITHEDMARSGKSFFLCLLLWVWVRLRRTCRHDGRSVWLSLCFLGEHAATFSRVCCFGDNVPAAVRLPDGGNCVSAAVKGRAGCLAAERIARPAQHRSCRASSITPQHRSRRHQHAARQRMLPPPRVRPEGDTSAVAF